MLALMGIKWVTNEFLAAASEMLNQITVIVTGAPKHIRKFTSGARHLYRLALAVGFFSPTSGWYKSKSLPV